MLPFSLIFFSEILLSNSRQILITNKQTNKQTKSENISSSLAEA